MEVERELDDSKKVENEQSNLDEDCERNLPAWMLTSDETLTQNEESASTSPPPAQVKEETIETAAPTSADGTSENKRIPCKYGDGCYRRNPAHKEEFSHPGDDDYGFFQEGEEGEEGPQNDDSKPECQYGTSCYRQNPQHKRDFKHTQPPRVDTPEDSPQKKKTRRPAKRPRRTDSDYESEGDKDYDLEDSFIDDTEDEEENAEEEEDEDYVPDVNDQVDPELLKEDQWEASPEDAPEVLELLKEARDYLRNKKLQK